MVEPVEDLALEIGDDVRSIEDALRKHTKPEVCSSRMFLVWHLATFLPV
jgi:hypothetical protein